MTGNQTSYNTMSIKNLLLPLFIFLASHIYSQNISGLQYSLSNHHPDVISDSGSYSWTDSAYVLLHFEAFVVDTTNHFLVKDKPATNTSWLNSYYFQYGDPVPGGILSYRQNGPKVSLGIGARSLSTDITSAIYLLAADSSILDSLSITISTP
ncbi:hypothetical protein [Salibacter halophilus]|uniref:Uncharacterized protein n=1 Tax=Salibacter halophilus TaxID=1803916 RepID=A0A6N6M813_9FLAO|nr:hypothetical protein [Salibacter halophilus]KAB1064891.1 hypothetical protein F3059_05935 [Salibacter halophilus]